ncbi:lyase family protein [Kineococcus rubinsiae]|uniref:lyase family protein n=1 Tax=Kineococcus rubinsiae TaxID=2609562 RepID=UPI00142F3F5F|nr:lyase family protein [Kineococcus rubinsiae]NIZ93689.1 3-carboxy-cis,cis-muconate cycloisomerase [Kineococcus rubinsiae]
MTQDLFSPGLHRAGDAFTDRALVRAAVAVEAAWLDVLAAAGLAPAGGPCLAGAAEDVDTAALAVGAEDGGNPVLGLLAVLRPVVARADGDAAAAWVHRGLTSQDVVDTALQLCARDVLDALVAELDAQADALADLVSTHRGTLAVARTLTQHALPTTFGVRAASWLTSVLDAREAVAAVRPVAQVGGAVGTLASLVDLLRRHGSPDPVATATAAAGDLAHRLGLTARPAWHTSRRPVTALGDALVTATDAFGHVAGDVLLGARPEVGELSEPAAEGRGGSSAMPQKRNPVLSVLVLRTAAAAPGLAAELHRAAASTAEERPAGAWHGEWAPLAQLARSALAAARQLTEVLTGLEVHPAAMARTLEGALPGVLAERIVPALAGLPTADGPLGSAAARRLAASTTVAELRAAVAAATTTDPAELERLLDDLTDPRAHLGTADAVVDAVLARAAARPAARPVAPHPPSTGGPA